MGVAISRAAGLVAVLFGLAGCASGGYDPSMATSPRTTVEVDGLPVYVAVRAADGEPGVYQVEAGEGRAIAFSSAQPLESQSRFRRAAAQVMRDRFAPATVTLLSEQAPSGYAKLWLRYSVQGTAK
jgi:hypothetical protein